MKMKNLLSGLICLSATALALVGCSDYDNGFTEQKLQYAVDFKDAYGNIDPEQDWNLVTRSSVTVTTTKSSEIMIYALVDGEYRIVGDYAGVNGEQTLYFDVLEGTERIIVTDGNTAIRIKAGGTATFGESRAANYGPGLTDLNGAATNINVSTSGQYIEFSYEQAKAYETVLPEINNDALPYDESNLGKVTQNFRYISNGQFSFYPIYWNTNGQDAIYVYYTDAAGTLHEVLVYTPKSGDELQDMIETTFEADWADATKPNLTEAQYLTAISKKSQVQNFTHDTATGLYSWTEYGKTYFYHEGEGYTKAVLNDDGSVKSNGFINCSYAENAYLQPSTAGYFRDSKTVSQRAKEILIDIPEGTPFGFMLKNGSDKFYSQASRNPKYPSRYGDPYQNQKACYAASIAINGEQYLCFEDWLNGDFDLNDVVFKFAGNVPTVIDEAPTAATWILACEDLGGSFDTDYNDVVLKVEHISGQSTATVTPLAAGGTLASYVFFQDPTTNSTETCLGEIHQLFGAGATTSGTYDPINVGRSRGSVGTAKTISVGKDWTMAYYTSESFATSQQYQNYNMGGFSIYVLPKGTNALTGTIYSTNSAFGDASIVAAPGIGETPEIICIPYSYTLYNTPATGQKTTYIWAWSQELCTVADGNGGGSYPLFATWVNDHNQGADWYKHPNGNTVSELKTVSDMNTASGTDSDDDDEDGGDEIEGGVELDIKTGQTFTYTDKTGEQTTYTNTAYIDFSSLDAPAGYTATLYLTFSSIVNELVYIDYPNGKAVYDNDNVGRGIGYVTSGTLTLSGEQLYKAQQQGGIYLMGFGNADVNLTKAVIVTEYGAPATYADDDDEEEEDNTGGDDSGSTDYSQYGTPLTLTTLRGVWDTVTDVVSTSGWSGNVTLTLVVTPGDDGWAYISNGRIYGVDITEYDSGTNYKANGDAIKSCGDTEDHGTYYTISATLSPSDYSGWSYLKFNYNTNGNVVGVYKK